ADAALEEPRGPERDALALAAQPSSTEREPSPSTPAPRSKSAAPTTGSLAVHVRWSDGTPAAGVTVNVRRYTSVARFPEHGLARGTSDAEGLARATELAPGGVQVFTGFGGEGTVEITAGEEHELELVLGAGLEVAGRVLDAQGAPVSGAEIWLT